MPPQVFHEDDFSKNEIHDLLHWSADTTRMPAEIHSFFLRNMYLEKNLVRPEVIILDGVSIDLGRIKTSSFILSTCEDHIVP